MRTDLSCSIVDRRQASGQSLINEVNTPVECRGQERLSIEWCMRRVGRWVASSQYVFIILVHTRITTTLKSELLACGSRKIAGTSARQGQRRVGKRREARRWRSNALSGDLHRSYRLLDWNRAPGAAPQTDTRVVRRVARGDRRATRRWAVHTSRTRRRQTRVEQQTVLHWLDGALARVILITD